MSGFIVCECCGARLPVTDADLGRAVVCPTSRRLVMVLAANVVSNPSRSRRGLKRFAVALLLLLLLGGVLTYALLPTTEPPQEQVVVQSRPSTDPPGTTVSLTPIHPSEPGLSAPDMSAERPPAVREVPKSVTTSGPATVSTPPVVATEPAPTDSTPTVEVPVPSVVEVPKPSPTDARGMTRHRLAKRIDLRSAEELQRELLAVREVSLDTPSHSTTTQNLVALARTRQNGGGVYPGPVAATRNRPALAGLPFRLGSSVFLFKDQAEALGTLSLRLRKEIQSCIPADDTRPDPNRLFTALLEGENGRFRNSRWATAEAVPCVQQMLQPEGKDVRRMSVELLRGIDATASTEALVRWAVLDLEHENRAAAVDVLKSRDPELVRRQLLTLLRYPWPRAAEHAAESLVALAARDAVPDLAAMLTLPDPDAPQKLPPGAQPGNVRHEMVRVNHARNCLLCHPPSFQSTDLVRGAVPDPTRPLPSPITPSYYNEGSQFVSAAGTYLRQDFSVVQPVASPGLWPVQQRYDYLVSVRRTDEASPETDATSPYRAAVLFALRELSGQDLGTTADNWATLRQDRTAPAGTLLDDAWRMVVLGVNPDPLVMLAWAEFGHTLLSLDESELRVVLPRFQRQFGPAGHAALMAYLGPLAKSEDATTRARATTLLERIRSQSSDVASREQAIDPEIAARLIGHKDPAVRAAAAAALAALGNKARPYWKLLAQALQDPHPEVRIEAARALGGIESGPDEMFDALAAATRDDAGQVREAVCEALTRLKVMPRSCAAALAEGLLTSGTWDSKAQQTQCENALAGLIASMGPRGAKAYPVLLDAAKGRTRTEASPAAISRAMLPLTPTSTDMLPVLVGLLAHPDYAKLAEVHVQAAGEDAVPPLIQGLQMQDEKGRIAAATLLGRVASISRNPPAARDSWRTAMDALAELKSRDESTAVKAAASAALVALTAR